MAEEMVQPPLVLSMVLADHIHSDPDTGKFSVLGTYYTILGREYPCHRERLWIYLALTDGRGEVNLQLRVIDVDELREPVYEGEASVSFSDPLQISKLALVCHDVTFPEPGEYRVQLSASGSPIRDLRLQLLE